VTEYELPFWDLSRLRSGSTISESREVDILDLIRRRKGRLYPRGWEKSRLCCLLTNRQYFPVNYRRSTLFVPFCQPRFVERLPFLIHTVESRLNGRIPRTEAVFFRVVVSLSCCRAGVGSSTTANASYTSNPLAAEGLERLFVAQSIHRIQACSLSRGPYAK
jgi:hypothetical protein